MSYANLVSDETAYLIGGTGNWTAESNCSIARLQASSPYETTLGSGKQNPSLLVRSLSAGDLSVVTEKFPVIFPGLYKASVWVGTFEPTQRTFSVGLRFYDVDDNLLLEDEWERFTSPNNWVQHSYEILSPELAYRAELFVKIKGTLPNEEFRVAHPAAFDSAGWYSRFLEGVMEYVPDFMIEEDEAIAAFPDRPLQRFVDVATRSMSNVNTNVILFDYIRAEDSSLGVDENSKLTDPYLAEVEWLGWLAQQAGVRITVTGKGSTTWDSFVNENIVSWTDWEENIVPGGTGPDTTWAELENLDPGTSSTLQAFRNQIYTGFNGVMSSTPSSISAYAQTLLETSQQEPFVFIRKHYRTNPWRIAVVVSESQDPDPNGTTLEDFLSSTAPAGMQIEVLRGAANSALMLYDASIFSRQIEGGFGTTVVDGYNELPKNGLNFIQDELGTGRHIVLVGKTTVDDWFNGGGVGASRYTVDENGFDGHALYSGYTKATIAADPILDITDDLDIQLFVSDVRPPSLGADPRVLVESNNKWGLYVNSSGQLQFQFSSGVTRTATMVNAINWERYAPFWIRVTAEHDGIASSTTVRFWAADDPLDGWTMLEEFTPASDGSIDLSAANAVYLFNDSAGADDSSTGVIHRAIAYDGIEGASLAAQLFDINFLSSAGEGSPFTPYIYPGVLSFTEDGPNGFTVNISSATAAPAELYEWVLLNRSLGTDFFHYGKSPFLYDGTNPGEGDTLSVSGLASANHDAVVYYYDEAGASATVSLGTGTSHNLDSDNAAFGGRAISSIEIQPAGGGAALARFTPDMMLGQNSATDQVDAGVTWTLTRNHFDGAAVSTRYQFSSTVDRDCFIPIQPGGIVRYGGFGYGASAGAFNYDDAAVSATYRRYWDNTDLTPDSNIAYAVTTVDGVNYGWRLDLDDDYVVATLFDGVRAAYLSWNEVAAGRLGQWNNVVLNLDPVADKVQLVVNGNVEDETGSFFANQYLSMPANGDYAQFPDDGAFDFGTAFEIQFRVAMDTWNGGEDAIQTIAAKGSTSNVNWKVGINTSQQTLHFYWNDGAAKNASANYSAASVPVPDDGAVAQYAITVNPGGNVEFERVFNPTSYPQRFGDETRQAFGSVAGSTSPSYTNTTVTLGIDPDASWEDFSGKLYGFIVTDDLLQVSVDTVRFDFANENLWSTHSVSGNDITGNYTATLYGNASIQAEPRVSLLPDYYPIDIKVFEQNEAANWQTYNLSQLAFYDHSLDAKEIAALVTDNNIQ